jgi:hypothetical protein
MSFQASSSAGGLGVESGPVTAIAGFALLVNLVGLFTFTGVALTVFAYVIVTALMLAWARRQVEESTALEIGTVLMVLSWITALVGGAIVGGLHWVQYAHAAYAVLGLYAGSAVVWLFGRALSAAWSFLFPAVGVALLTAVMQLGSPPGADDMEEQENWTPVNVAVVDDAGEPIAGAKVYLDLVQFWQGEPELDGDREWWTKDETGADGEVKMQLQDDPRFKRLLIRVRHEPETAGFNEPTTIAAAVGHDDARLTVVLPEAKVPYSFRIVMHERPHLDAAFLAIELATADGTVETPSRSLKLALTAEPELRWDEDRRTFDEDAVNETGRMRYVYLSQTERIVFRLGRNLAGRPLTLHVLEAEPTQYREAYRELATVGIAPISPGARRDLPPLVIPTRDLTARRDEATLR